MIVTYTTEPGQKLTSEQRAQLAEAKKMPIVFDEDCPELTVELEKAFRAAARMRNRHFQLDRQGATADSNE